LGNTSRLKAGTELHLAEVAEHGIALNYDNLLFSADKYF
jgi:hypothetical protein